MSNIVKWAAVSDEETFAKVRVEFSFGDGVLIKQLRWPISSEP